jgi:hypothetical protein
VSDRVRLDVPSSLIGSGIAWDHDVLVTTNMDRLGLDGTVERSHVFYDYPFDRVLVSGEFVVLYANQGTKAILIRDGRVVRELDRRYQHAAAYDYPIGLFRSPGGRQIVAHCSTYHGRIELDDAVSGEELTRRTSQSPDIFHSRLSASPSGSWLLSTGWVWHPVGIAALFDVEEALANPEHLDGSAQLASVNAEIDDAAFLDDRVLVVATTDEEDLGWSDRDLGPMQIGRFSLEDREWVGVVKVDEPVGTLMAVDSDRAIGFYGHPKLFDLRTGKVLRRWQDLSTGDQRTAMSRGATVPPLALDPSNRRFAVADDEGITVVQVG